MKNFKILLFLLVLGLFFTGQWAVSQTSIRAGVASMITPVSVVKYYQQVVEYIGSEMGLPVEMVHRTTYDEIDVMLEKQEVDVAFICSSPCVLDNEKFGVELLVAPQVNNKDIYYTVEGSRQMKMTYTTLLTIFYCDVNIIQDLLR